MTNSRLAEPLDQTVNCKLLFVVGPTAVGKSAFAIDLAEQINGEIISADSRYFYRGMDIGTAKPTQVERARVNHHLVDVTTPDVPWSLAEYCQSAKSLVEQINNRKHLPLCVGGTGQYVRALTEGWTIPKSAEDSALRSELQLFAEHEGGDALYDRLVKLDPVAASKIHKHNIRRTIRALEVITLTGQLFSQQSSKQSSLFDIKIIGLTLEREKLYARIDSRIDAMMANGLLEETQALVAQGYHWGLPALSAIGYKQLGMYLRGECDLNEAVRLIKHDTRRFVRQQYSWFRLTDPTIQWWDVEELKIESVIKWLGDWATM